LACWDSASHSTLLGDHPLHKRTDADFKEVDVTTTSLDGYFANNLSGLAIDFLKVDTEGFEVEVLNGATSLLAFCQGLQFLIECHSPENLEAVKLLLPGGRLEKYSVGEYWTNL
jgi:FkbM family methyltransferase